MCRIILPSRPTSKLLCSIHDAIEHECILPQYAVTHATSHNAVNLRDVIFNVRVSRFAVGDFGWFAHAHIRHSSFLSSFLTSTNNKNRYTEFNLLQETLSLPTLFFSRPRHPHKAV